MNPSSLVTTTQAVDTAFYVIFGISAVSLLGIIVAMVYFVWRYNRKRQPQPISQKDHNVWLEITWTIIPTILVMVMFWYGWEGYLSLRRIPDGAMPVTATARMWSWLFTYENGKTADKLFVPVGQPVKVELIAEDVLHSFYVPAFRVKRDCVPGMPAYAWFVAEKPGSYNLFCAEYCGVGHADMITTVEALPPEEFDAWLTAAPAAGEAGLSLLQKHGCLGCHSQDGSRGIGPTFQGIAGRQVVVVTDGSQRTVTIDRDYLEKSIVEPGADIVESYPPAMPSYAGRIPDEELAGILDYLMGLTADGAAKEQTPAAEESSPATSSEAAQPADAEETMDKPVATKQPAAPPASPEAKPAPDQGPAQSQQPPSAAADPAQAQIARGETLANQNGCLGCHSLDGSRKVGPTLLGLAGSERAVTRDGQEATVVADHAYLVRAIREPGAEITKGYPPAMPAYGQLSEADIKALIAWIESLK